MIRFGLIGCGGISAWHIAAIEALDDTILTAVCDRNESSADKIASEHDAEAFHDIEKMLSSGKIDAIAICTPSGSHASIAISALKHGIYPIVEKPMAITPASLDALLEAEKESDAFICPISQLRFFPDVIRVKGWLEAGIMGRMTMVDLSMKYWRSEDYYINNPWRGTWEHDGGGALMNQGIHGLDLLRWLCSTPDCISASADTLVHDIETEDTLSASLRFSSGALGVMSVSTAAFPGFPRRLEICCEKGSLTLEEGHLVACTLPDAETSSNTRSGHSDPAAIDFLPHQLQYENIVGAIEQKAPLAVTSEDAAQTLRLIFDIYSRAGIRKG